MEEQIRNILETICPEIDFDNEKALFDNGLIESFEVIRILSELMECFDIDIDPEEIEPENLNSLEAFVELVRRSKGST